MLNKLLCEEGRVRNKNLYSYCCIGIKNSLHKKLKEDYLLIGGKEELNRWRT